MHAKALWITGAGKAVLRSESIPSPAEDDALVRTLFSGISRGTESLVLAGRVPETEHERMRAPHQAGEFTFPVKYGYSSVGVVEQGPRHLVGKPVFCLYPHQDIYQVPVGSLVPLPDAVPPARAVLAANMETALNVLWDSGVAAGDRVAVIGCGVVGALVAYIAARTPGTDVTIVDVQPSRSRIAERLGCAFVSPEAAPRDCDVVIHASATSAGLDTAIACAGLEAVIVEASWYGAEQVTAHLGGAFHSRRLKLVSSQVGRVPAGQAPRWPLRRRLDKALALLADERLDVLISGETPFAEAGDRYPSILADTNSLCHRFTYS